MPFKNEKDVQVVSISSKTFEWFNTCGFIDRNKSKYPRVHTVVGGKHPTYWAENCLKDSKSLDFVAVGEGEFTLSELLSKLENREALDSIEGLIYRNKGDFRVNKKRNQIPYIDKLPLPIEIQSISIFISLPLTFIKCFLIHPCSHPVVARTNVFSVSQQEIIAFVTQFWLQTK